MYHRLSNSPKSYINKISVDWLRILVYKFLGGLISLSVGREEPSVQMGASIGEGLANKFVRKLHAKEEFLITAIAVIISPVFFGGGHEIIVNLAAYNSSISGLVILCLIKFLLLLICFCSGVPGGIFLPMLLLGALIREIFGNISTTYFGLSSIFLILLLLLWLNIS